MIYVASHTLLTILWVCIADRQTHTDIQIDPPPTLGLIIQQYYKSFTFFNSSANILIPACDCTSTDSINVLNCCTYERKTKPY